MKQKNAGNQIRCVDLYNKRIKESEALATSITPVIIAEGLRTPENIASILRLAEATGVRRVIFIDSEININNKKINRIARDSIKYLEIEQKSMSEFIELAHDYEPLFALEITTNSKDLFKSDLSGMFSLVVGSERHGVSQKLLDMCSKAIHIPMYGKNGSMNVAQALGIALYEWRRQTGAKINI